MSEKLIEFKHVYKSFEHHEVLHDINLHVYKGEFLTLLGPSGCGKTTLLRMISGFETPDKGEITLLNQNLAEIPPQLRHVNTVFQSYALFPHLTVYDNVAFGLRCQRFNEAEIRKRVLKMLETVKLEALVTRKPQQLSGGQQQRVAIARAMVNEPQVLLLDEPLSSLDYRLRKNMQIELKQLQRKLGIAFIFVTHDQEEAISMSDRVVVIDQGYVQQIGTPREVYEEPKNLTVAKFIGEVNIFDTQVTASHLDEMQVNINHKSIRVINNKDFQVNDKVHVLVRPEDIRVWSKDELADKDMSNMLIATVQEVIYKGTTVDLIVKLKNGLIISATEFFDEDDDKLEYTIGETVWINWLSGWEMVLPNET